MRIQDHDSICNATNPTEVAAALSRRHAGGRNGFWLSHGAKSFPAINIMVLGDLAHLHYLSEEHHPGYTSEGSICRLPKGGDKIFFPDTATEPTWIMNETVVPFSDALKAAQEFAVSHTMPKCIRWNSLVKAE